MEVGVALYAARARQSGDTRASGDAGHLVCAHGLARAMWSSIAGEESIIATETLLFPALVGGNSILTRCRRVVTDRVPASRSQVRRK